MNRTRHLLCRLMISTWAVAALASCEEYTTRFSDDELDTSQLPWPQNFAGSDPCDSPDERFSEPLVAAPSGDVRLRLSASLQPVGAAERIEIEIQTPGGGGRDASATGELLFDAGPNASLLEIGQVDQGRAYAVVLFHEEGRQALSAMFRDETGERTGHVEVIVYRTQLPIFELTIDPENLDRMLDNPSERIKVPASLAVDGEAYETTVRIHGGSSRDYPKKSFRFDLGEGLALPDTHDHIILRAEWNDKSMLRNYLGLETVRGATWLHTPRAEMVHFRINQRYYGVMWRVERVGGDFLRTRGLNNETGSLYEADPAGECSTPGGNLTPLPSAEEYRCVYDHKKGELDYEDLLDLIKWLLQLPEGDFEVIVNDVVNVNDALVYFAVMAVIQNHDHIKKNYYLFRDPEADDDRWIIIPWDLELTFGHLWTEENDVLDEQIFTDEPLDFGAHSELGYGNQMFSRLYGVDEYRERFHAFVRHIVETAFTIRTVDEKIDSVLCRAAPDILADTNKRGTNEEYLGRVEEIRAFVAERRAYILEEEP